MSILKVEMMENYWAQPIFHQTVVTSGTLIDARNRGTLTTCSLKGAQTVDGRTCKFFEKATYFKRCMYYREDTSHCDNPNKQEFIMK